MVASLILTATLVDVLYGKRIQSWKRQTGVMFKQSLELELQKRDTVHYKIFVKQANLSLDNRPLYTLRNDSGKQICDVPKIKYDNSLVKGVLKRYIVSNLLEESPLLPDTLNEYGIVYWLLQVFQ
ncbi:MAG: hypothetical protein KH897_05310 [Bacteroides sp.]|jgi:hypothetical protein|uniref:hypothetical protein n=1 Tax=Bacteroides sp. TaxID=29523 RepID=UPI0025BBC913|nr:hypothetical protein [Bacteroides sp.]MBS6237801.1 hypothetical protein [Bacteroides sp.]